MNDSAVIKVGLVGVTGRMGREIARLATAQPDLSLVAAISSGSNPHLGKTLREAGICDSQVQIRGPEALQDAAINSQVIISFTNATAELENIPQISSHGTPLVIGTTGFTDDQLAFLKSCLRSSPVVISSNFSIGANILFRLTSLLAKLPIEFDISIIEAHHSGKADAPSGTAKKLSQIMIEERGYSKVVSGRMDHSERKADELEVLSIRAGGIVGRHTVMAASQYEMVTIGHEAFSRAAFVNGALTAARWVVGKKPGIYSMTEVLSLQ